ncbi:MAG: outer membrane lipoprotein carrier protein LolA, partial [Vicinamibacterales bacterium]
RRYVTIERMTCQRAAIVACLLASLAMSRGSAPDLFDEIYARGKPLESSLATLTAHFTETSHSPLLVKPLVASGTVSVIRPARVAMHYTVPERRSVIIDGGRLYITWPSQGINRSTPIGATEKRIQQYFVGRTPEQLRSHFTISAEPAESNRWHVLMTPKRKRIRDGMSTLELWIDRTTVMMTSMRMVFPGGNTKRLDFDDVRINPTINEALFRVPPP